MLKTLMSCSIAALLSLAAFPAFAHGDSSLADAPPEAPYQKVSDLVPLPEFIPGLGQLFVDPATLPAGPFLAYDREGALVSTIYMIPIEDLNPDTSFDALASPGGSVDHVSIHYNAGHPGVEMPHAHIILWHVPADEQARLSQ